MTALVTVEQAKRNMQIDFAHDDGKIGELILDASAAVLTYIGDAQYLFLDTGGELLYVDTSDTSDTSTAGAEQESLRAARLAQRATLLLVAHWYRYPSPTEGQANVPASFGYGYLPGDVVAVLYPLRTPTFV